ncbi:MAG: hypothetical protein K2X76_01585 [Sphingomonas sp.]|nr:hypothetical protein [Sphingomonas sp.]
MAGGVAEFLLKQAWKLLWKPGTPYYLPTVLVDGASGDGHQVPPLGNRPVPDLGPFGLFGDSTFGEVNLSLSHGQIGGLGSAADGGFTYDETTAIFTATINWQGLSYAGDYAVTGNGLVGCAAAGAAGLMKVIPAHDTQVEAVELGAGEDDPRLQQARDYRDKLVQTPAGLELVGTYYDNNWAMNEIVRGDNVFTSFMNQKRAISAGLADQTSAAAAAPNDPNKTVGDTDYYVNSMLRQVVFERACQNAGGGGGDDPFADAAAATLSFKGLVNANYAGAVTVGQVMTEVAAAPAGAVARHLAAGAQGVAEIATADAFRSEEARLAYQRAEAEAEAFISDYEARGGPNRLFSELALLGGDLPIGAGSFNDSFAAPNVVINGTVTVTGDPNNPQLTVTLTKLVANLPSINISLSSGGWAQPSLYDRVTQALANAGFVHDLIRQKLGDKLGDATVLAYLSARINDAINKALGDF